MHEHKQPNNFEYSVRCQKYLRSAFLRRRIELQKNDDDEQNTAVDFNKSYNPYEDKI